MAFDKFGLRELPEDKRDFQLGMFTVLPKLEDLPEEFELERLFPPADQGPTDFCSAYASCGMSQIQEGVELYPEFSFALSKEITGNPEDWGQDLRTAMKSQVKFGAVSRGNVTDAVKALNETELRYVESYPDTFKSIAIEHKKKSYFAVSGPYSHYDNIRATIFKYRSAVAIGVIFAWDIYAEKLDTIDKEGYGHAMYVSGWTKDGLRVVNSYGTRAGNQGTHIMTPEVINYFAGKFGMFCMLDIEKDQARELLDRAGWTKASFIGKIIILISRWWQGVWK